MHYVWGQERKKMDPKKMQNHIPSCSLYNWKAVYSAQILSYLF